MPLTIKRLNTTVRLKSTHRESPQHHGERPARPSMPFAMPIAAQTSESGPVPNKTATEGKGAASGRGPISARNVDPHKVADRVYDLMKQEIVLGRMRGGY